MSKTQKITAFIMLIGLAAFVAYDIFILNEADDSTLSVVMFIMLKFPLIIYGWMLLAGHFMSFLRLKKQYIGAMVIVSTLALFYSIFSVLDILPINRLIIAIFSVIGYIVGMVCWSQKAAVK